MPTIESGFHPWLRLVRRLSRITPHRQIQLLWLISVVTVIVMASAVLLSLGPTQRSLQASNQRLVPALRQLDKAREAYNSASRALPLTIDPDPAVRTKGLNQLTSANTVGESSWNAFQRRSVHLAGEESLAVTFEIHRKGALQSGAVFLSQPLPTAAGLADVSTFSSALLLDLNRMKALYESRVLRSLANASDKVDSTAREIMIISAGALVILLVAFAVATRSARSREERLYRLDRALHEDAEHNELEARLQRSLEMAHTEAATYPLVARALTLSVPGVPAELLVADSSRAHFHQVATAADASGPGCPVSSPTECPAATWGQTQSWSSSEALDACPHLQNRPGGACSAVCVPVSLGGKIVGVVHATAADNQPPPDRAVAKIELIARKVGERMGMLRAFARSETQAHTDPLTGLMNRRSLEEEVREIVHEGPYVTAYGDLDHFKQLNDVYGHDAGDQALRAFARVLRETVRPNDLTARYGGEEFVVVLPNCTLPDAFAVVDRIREALALAQVSASGPRFTVSFGIAASQPHQSFSETLEAADAALLEAKASGRDRVIIANSAIHRTGIISEPVSSDEPTISSTRS